MRFAILLLVLCGSAQAASLALVHGNLVDVERRTVIADATVVIDGDKIIAAGRARNVRVPADARVIDVRGKWIAPGLVDAHIHLFQSGGLYTRPDAIDLRKQRPYETERTWLRENAGDLLARYLAAGVTTVIDIGGPLANYALRDQYNKDVRSPTILLTGPLVSTWQPPAFLIEDAPILQAADPAAARAMVRNQLPYRPDFIKIWYIVRDASAESTLPIIQATIDEAHAHDLKVAVHATQLKTAKLALGAGADILVHSVDDAPVDAEFIALLKKRAIPYIPTLIVSKRYFEVFTQQYAPTSHDFALANPFALGSLDDLAHLPSARRGPPSEAAVQALADRERVRKENLRQLAAAGVLIATGTDAGNIGTAHASSYFEELVQMGQAGLSPWEVLRASTLNGARVLGKQSEFGSIAAGKRADLVVLDRDPVADVHNLEAVHAVVNRGNWLEPQALIDSSPAALVQRQLNACNHGDVDAFLEPYSDVVEISQFPNEPQKADKAAMRERYDSLFKKFPKLHCELVNRIVLGETVIDHERLHGMADTPVDAVAIYTIKDRRISRVAFVR